jgi:hypothetical protein
MIVQNVKTIRVPILGLSHEDLRKKCHLDVTPVESHKIYYKEGSGVSFQR